MTESNGKSKWFTVGFCIGLGVGTILAATVHAADFKLIELDSFTARATQFFDKGRDAYITHNDLPNRELGARIESQMRSSILKVGFFDAKIHGTTDRYADTHQGGQFRFIGLEIDAGVRITDQIRLGYHHHSQHVLDSAGKLPWPVQDGVFLEVKFYGKDR